MEAKYKDTVEGDDAYDNMQEYEDDMEAEAAARQQNLPSVKDPHLF